MESTQTITEGKEIRMTIDIYLFLYARKVVEEVRLLTRKHCFGCRNNHPSQRNHSCLMMSELEQLNIYFDDALENVDCEELLELWKRDTKLTDISLELKNTFINLLQNCEWRENNLPDKDGFYKMTKKIIQLGDRFTN